MYIDNSIREYLNVVQSGDPTPGGGSVCSLVSSLGGALTRMTSNLSFDKKYFKELEPSIQEEVKESHRAIEESIEMLNEYIDKDAEGFSSVIKAYEEEVESETKEDKAKRLEESYKKALDTPLNVCRECLELLESQKAIVKYGNEDTITDVGVGVILVYAALEGCMISVRINLNYLEDKEYIKKTKEELNAIYKNATTIKNSLVEKVEEILGSESFV